MPSSVVQRYTYNRENGTLRVIFVSGLIYDYKNVPEEVYHAMKKFTSKGQFLNSYIKPNYKYKKISNGDEGAAPDAH